MWGGCGQNSPPRGWLSRYYGEKMPVPSLNVGGSVQLPFSLVTILSPMLPSVAKTGNSWCARTGNHQPVLDLRDGRFERIQGVVST